MKSIKIFPLEKSVEASITLPGCLSYTIRAMVLAAATDGRVKVVNALKSDDTYTMFDAFKKLGIRCEEGKDFFIIEGNLRDVKEANYEINANISGRSARSLIALLCFVPGIKVLKCGRGFKGRPVGDLVDGLIQLGAKIEYLEEEGYLPLKIISSSLYPGTVKLRGEISSQFVSAILMIAPLVGEMNVEVPGEQASKPFVDMTIEAMNSFGVRVVNSDYKTYFIKGGQEYNIKEVYLVEPDAIQASYFWSIAALTGSKIKVLNLSPLSKQGDVAYADFLGRMGCAVRKDTDGIEIEGAKELRGLKIDMNNNPDTVLTLAVTAAFAKGRTVIDRIEHLKVKETDRIEAPRRELKKMGVNIESGGDFLLVNGGGAHGAIIDTYGDHRMAMAFAVAGARIPGMVINNPDVVNKSFPNFWDKLEEIGVGLRVSEI